MTSDNHSGIVGTLMALILLTLFGVFLSIVVDKRLSASGSRNEQKRIIAENEGELHMLAETLASRKEELAANSSGGITEPQPTDGGNSAMTLKDDVAALSDERSKLRIAITDTVEEFSNYRTDYRNAEWEAAHGERIDSLFLKSGRHFEKVIINRVTPYGMEVTHSRGSARIEFKDLGRDYRDRFQWDEIEDVSVSNKPTTVSPDPKASHEPPRSVNQPSKTIPAEKDQAAIASLRNEITLWQTKINTMRSEYSYASSQESRKSMPGSLRTWGERASSLRASIAKSEAALALAREKLRSYSTSDSALMTPSR